jgi:ribosomal-protein-alanine N-acetyltransferase
MRAWRYSDRSPFAAMNADPEVMEHFPSTLTRRQSDALLDRCEAHLEREGFGLWATEVAATGEFIGFVGLVTLEPGFPFAPGIEVGWRLARHAWGHGYACEAASASLDLAFGALGADEVVSFTATTNVRSQRVMQRLGMTRDDDDFDHPSLLGDDRLRRHVLYRITAAAWRGRTLGR